jgi:hypothetical protein
VSRTSVRYITYGSPREWRPKNRLYCPLRRDVGSCTSVPEVCLIVGHFVLIFYFLPPPPSLCFLFPLFLRLPRIRPSSPLRPILRTSTSSLRFRSYYATTQLQFLTSFITWARPAAKILYFFKCSTAGVCGDGIFSRRLRSGQHKEKLCLFQNSQNC